MLQSGVVVEFVVEFAAVAFGPGSKVVFNVGKTPLEPLRPLQCGNVVGKHFSEAITTIVPYLVGF